MAFAAALFESPIVWATGGIILCYLGKCMLYKTPLEFPIKLSGIITFRYYENVFGKNILLLGETHKLDNICKDCSKGCVDIHRYLYYLAKNSNVCLDIFVEDSYFDKIAHKLGVKYNKYNSFVDNTLSDGLDKWRSPINFVRNAFRNCNTRDKETCQKEFPNLRYHFWDIRKAIFSYDDNNTELTELEHLVEKELDDDYMMDSIKFINYLYGRQKKYKQILGSDDEKLGKISGLLLLDTISLTKYKKLFRNIVDYLIGNDNNVGEKKFRGIQKLYGISKSTYSIRPILQRHIKRCAISNVIIEQLVENRLQKIDEQYLSILFISFITDLSDICTEIYLLTRIFGKFTYKKRKPLICSDILSPKNVIVYAGNSHCDIVKEFLISAYNIYPSFETENTENCVDLPAPFNFFNPNKSVYQRTLIDNEEL